MHSDFCIHMALDKSEKSYFPQICTPLQKPINDPITKEEPMDSTDSDVPNLIYIP